MPTTKHSPQLRKSGPDRCSCAQPPQRSKSGYICEDLVIWAMREMRSYAPSISTPDPYYHQPSLTESPRRARDGETEFSSSALQQRVAGEEVAVRITRPHRTRCFRVDFAQQCAATTVYWHLSPPMTDRGST